MLEFQFHEFSPDELLLGSPSKKRISFKTAQELDVLQSIEGSIEPLVNRRTPAMRLVLG
jgi:hypothetical protein